MKTRVAVMGIIVENTQSVEQLNALLHEYGAYIIGRMGIPYRERGINIVSIAIDAPQDAISALSGKIGNPAGHQREDGLLPGDGTVTEATAAPAAGAGLLPPAGGRNSTPSWCGASTKRPRPPGRPGWAVAARRAPLRGQGVHPGAHRDRQRVPQRLPLLRHSAAPTDAAAANRLTEEQILALLPGGLGAGLSHLCAPGGRGPARRNRHAP